MAAPATTGVHSHGGERPFWIGRERPGALSPDGPRHDNDSEDITQIRVLPTTAEILSTRSEYLPVYDSRQWHLPGLPGLIDRHFRLFREDNVAGLRAPVRAHLEGGRQRTSGLSLDSSDILATNIYNVASVILDCSEREGFALRLAISQPSELSRSRTDADRERWWVQSKKLEWNNLVCLVGKGYAMFCQVCPSTCRKAASLSETVRHGKYRYKRDRTMFNSQKFAYLTLNPADLKPSDIDFMGSVSNNTATKLVLIEFPSVVLAAFKPILSSLQMLSGCDPHKVPLAELVVGSFGPVGDHYHDILPPAYTMRSSGERFRFNLKVLLNDKTNMRYSPQSNPHEHVYNLCRKSILDEGQATALVNCLRRRLALIQGPPGTGKSFTGEAIIEVLLANKVQGRLGPIICVCQTNHALDQLLEHLYIRKGIRQMIRLGPNSRSPTISKLDLRGIMSDMAPPRPVRNAMKLRNKAAKDISRTLEQLNQAAGMSVQAMSEIKKLAERYNQLEKHCDAAWAQFKASLLRNADIIGVTTTGLSSFRTTLCQVGSKVVICEEAGEVLEAHMLPALMPSVQHLILIGDHQQLRPHINNRNFQMTSSSGRSYAVDLSLYERLVRPLIPGEKKLSFDTLTIQRRMHPAIANLVRATIYPSLRDADNVSKYPELAGFKRRLFWLHHEKQESSSSRNGNSSFSFTNSHEIGIVKVLVDYLVRQGTYADGEIAIITPYAGQLRALQTRLGQTYDVTMNERDAEEQRQHISANSRGRGSRKLIRVATVDNFQGEEASVVIVSLVRSNVSERCGFLSEPNRANVLLSRAKHGMILIGNSYTYGSSEIWWKIIQMLRADGNMGTSFEVPCPRHIDGTALVSSAAGFLNPSCTSKCRRRLSCGHTYTGERHPDSGPRCTICSRAAPGTGGLETASGRPVSGTRALKSAPTPPETPQGHMPVPPQPATTRAPTPPLIDLLDDDGSPDFTRCRQIFQHPILEDMLTTFVCSSHSQLAMLELNLLDEQAVLKPRKGSMDFARRVASFEWLVIKGDGFDMIKNVHSWVGPRYDHLWALSKRIDEQHMRIRQEEEGLRARLVSFERFGRKVLLNDYDVISRLRLQAKVSLQLLLLRCQVVIVADCIELHHHTPFGGRAIILLDFTRLIAECESIIQAAQEAHFPRLEAEARILAARMIGLNVHMLFAGQLGLEEWELKEQYHKRGAEHVKKALGGVLTHASLSYLLEDLRAAEDILGGEDFRSTVGIEERRAFWTGHRDEFPKSGLWYLCTSYHPFSTIDNGRHGRGLFCPVCGAQPRGQEPASQQTGSQSLLDLDVDDSCQTRSLL